MTRPESSDFVLTALASEAEPGTPASGSYSQWIRKMIRAVRSERTLLVSLFDSSVPEPFELLRQIVLDGFSEPTTSRYTSAFNGNPYVVQQLARRYGVSDDQILSTTGATGALSLIYRALAGPGDHVLVEAPGFDLFHTIAHTHGLSVDGFERRGDKFTIDPDEIAAKIGPRTRLIVLSNLHNPSGMALDPGTLAAVARLAKARGIHVIVDEVYADYVDPERRPSPGVTLSPAVISVNSLTKSYGLSTLRCGWIVAEDATMRRIRALAEETEFGISNLAHAVAALVLERPAPFDSYRDEILRKARPIIESYHAHWQGEGLVSGTLPQFGCIAFPRLCGIDDTIGFSEWLADRCGVIVAPAEYFGSAGHVRIGFARAPADVDYGLQALTDGLIHYRDLQAGKRGG
ncbi:pyridoxal phosphate-dependent aminotransferase [Sphingomonas sp. HF-S3]|uniref:Pyridoxal phosphate-dependent aminotransferase n=1 Tax=Sphingomonas rustica TaxID=3103142 RepID=A0ABV0B816_9SPHN